MTEPGFGLMNYGMKLIKRVSFRKVTLSMKMVVS